jgi:hypothetical protein
MFRVEQRFEVQDPVLLSFAPDARQYHIVEQVLDVPLWRVEVMNSVENGKYIKKNERVWEQYLISQTSAAVAFANSRKLAKTKISVIVPAYLTQSRNPELAVCKSIWEACALDDSKHLGWIFETSIGTFSDPQYGLEIKNSKKIKAHWKMTRERKKADSKKE